MTEFHNKMVLMAHCDRQVARESLNKTGGSVNIRKPVRYIAVVGNDITGAINDTVEGSITFTVDEYRSVPMLFTETEKTLTIEKFTERYISPAVDELVQTVETYIGSLYYKFFWFAGTPGTAASTYVHIGEMEALLDEAAVPMSGRRAFFSPRTMIQLADSLKGIFPTGKVLRAIEKSSIGEYANFDVVKSQSLPTHTVGVNTGTPLIDGASQEVTYATAKDGWTQTLITDGWTADTADILLQGDVFTIADVYAVNPRTRVATTQLQTFSVQADADSGATTGPATLTISPPIIISGAYQTVDSSPADDAAITVKTGAGGELHKQNLGWTKDAVALVFAPLVQPGGGLVSHSESHEGVSMLYAEGADILTLDTTYRLDILFGADVVNPGMGIRRTD